MKAIKTSITLLISFAFCICASAQDILVKKDGSVLQIKTEEISETTIKYRLWSNQTGPLRSISIENVVSINYANGEIERFNNEVSTPNQPTQNVAQPTMSLLQEEEPMKPAIVTIPEGMPIPIYSDLTFKRADFFKHRKCVDLCLCYVGENIFIDNRIVIPKGSEVYGRALLKFSLTDNLDLELLYIQLPNGTQILTDGILHIWAPGIGKFHLKERTSICTVKEDVTIQLTD